MSAQYPKMLYRDGKTLKAFNAFDVDTCIVNDADAEEAALADGWRLSPDPLDHDGDGRKGGARRKKDDDAPLTPEDFGAVATASDAGAVRRKKGDSK